MQDNILDVLKVWCHKNMEQLTDAGIEEGRVAALEEIVALLEENRLEEAVLTIRNLPRVAKSFVQPKSSYNINAIFNTEEEINMWMLSAVLDTLTLNALNSFRVNIEYDFHREITAYSEELVQRKLEEFKKEMERISKLGELC